MYASGPKAVHQSGFAYVALLIAVATLSALSAGTLRVGQVIHRHASEQELLDKGWTLTQALESYQRATPTGQNPYPQRIDDLLHDPRFPKKTIRHLRNIELDPMTGSTEWGVVMSEDGKGIAGFHSLSSQKPLRQELGPPFSEFNQKAMYSEWVFVAGLGG